MCLVVMARKYVEVLEPEKGRDLCRVALTDINIHTCNKIHVIVLGDMT